MPNYQYKALTNIGKSVQGVLQANSRAEVLGMLRQQEIYPLSVQEAQGKDLKTFNLFGNTKVKDLAVFCRQFYTMLNSGISIIKCLEILRQQVENSKLKTALTSVYEDVQKGTILSTAMQKHLSFGSPHQRWRPAKPAGLWTSYGPDGVNYRKNLKLIIKFRLL